MSEPTILPEREPDGYFASYQTWVCKATSWIGGTNSLCADAKGRVCRIGSDMMRARDEDAFPVRFWFGAGPKQTTKQAKQSKRDYHAAMRLQYPWRYSNAR